MRRLAVAWLLPLLLPRGAAALQEEVAVSLGPPSAPDVLEDSRGADDFLPPADSVGDDLVGPDRLAEFGAGPPGLAEFGAASASAAPAAAGGPALGAGAAGARVAAPPSGAAASALPAAPAAAGAGEDAEDAEDAMLPIVPGNSRAAGAAAELLAPAARARHAPARPDAPLDANSTLDRQHALREVARARATRVKYARSSRSILDPSGGDHHINVVLIIVLVICLSMALTMYAIGVDSARDCSSLFLATSSKGAPSEHAAAHRVHRQLAIRAGISPLRSSLAPPWPQRQPRAPRRVGFDPTTAGLPSAESLESAVGTLNAAPPTGATFPPPQRWAASSAGPSARQCSDSDGAAGVGFGVSATLSTASAATAYSLGSFGGTWGRLEPRQGAAAAA